MTDILTYSDSISFSSNRDSEEIISETQQLLLTKLNKMKPTTLLIDGEALYFSAGIRLVLTNWNLLNSITAGEVQITRSDKSISLAFKLNFIELAVLSLFLTAPTFYFMSAEITDKIFSFVFLNIFFFGGNAALTIFRFTQFLKVLIADILERDHPAIPKGQLAWTSDPFKCDACGHVINEHDKTCPNCGLTLR